MTADSVSTEEAPLRPTLRWAETQSAEARREGGELRRGEVLERYIVVERLGAGGMGVVYAAFDPELSRKVAIKLIRGGATGSSSTRLLREARAMARLTHPNVIAVHDVGEIAGQVFVAMEFVEGPTLRAWQERAARPWREVVEVYLQAGRGLAAAHRAGLVHRDFKPDNVLVGEDGRVRVLDFGLARAVGDAAPAEDVEPSRDTAPATADLGRLTVEGSIVGTPAYMAPEQRLALPVDARCDQFSFCVALWEGLSGELPYQADNQLALLAAIREQKAAPIPKERGVPTWVTRALLRGMRAIPGERYPRIDDLLAELARDPARTRRRGLLALGLAVGVVAAVVRSSAPSEEPDRCGGAERASAGVWDVEQREAGLAAFRATGEPYAESAHRRSSRRLDERLDAWRAMYTDACAATQIRGEQSAELMDRRMACLQERLEETRALARAFAAADAQVVARAVQATEELRGLDGCADLRGLTEARDEPADPERRREVAALRIRLAEVNGAWAAGRYAQARALVEPVLATAAATGSCGLVADAAFAAGRVACTMGQVERGSAELAESVWRATACRRDETAAEAILSSLYCSGVRLARYDEAAMWARHAEAALERLGGPQESRRAALLGYRGLVAFDQGRFQEARALHEEALALAERAVPDSARVGNFIGYLGITLERLGEFERSLELHREAMLRAERVLGAEHPTMAVHFNNIGNLLSRLGRPAEALPYSERDLELSRRALGERHPDVALSYINHAAILCELGRHAEAVPELLRARTILEELGRREHPDYIVALNNFGELSAELGDDEAARASLHEALDRSARLQGDGHLDATYAELALAGMELRAGRTAAARAHVTHAREVRLAALGPDHEETVETEVMLGRIEAAEGRCPAAEAHYAAARRSYDAAALPPTHQERRTLAWCAALCRGGAELEAAASSAMLLPGSPELRAEVLLRAADQRWARGQHDLARETARTAARALAGTGPGLAALRARAEGWTGGR